MAFPALAINPGLDCIAVVQRFNASNAAALVEASDVVVDATDNLATRYLINDACVLGGKPLVSGAALGFDGQVGGGSWLEASVARAV